VCDCPEARAYRAYWTREAIAERLAAEVALYRGIVRDAVWWGGSTSPVPPRVPSSPSRVQVPDSFAAKEALRDTPGAWPPRHQRV